MPRSEDKFMEAADKSFPVVGIGASAGGLEAVSELLAALPAQTGMAYLLVQHLDPRHESLLAEILAKKTEVAVETAADGTILTPDHLYVIPPNTTMTLADGVLRLQPRDTGERPPRPVNVLFRSLAEQYGHRAVAVVLSGSDSDGAEGLEEIKNAGGITMAQEPSSAKFDGMPKSAIATGCVDLVLSPEDLGKEMLRIVRHPYLTSDASLDGTADEGRLRHIFRLLQNRNGTDFSRYKRSTLQRRLARRMALRQVDGLKDYVELLNQEPDEVQALAQDFLIRVTGFFRDPEAFIGLSETIFPALFEHRSPNDPLRIWVPGCASGQEAYSIAMVLMEYLGEHSELPRVQIFGTDLSDAAIEKARAGFYADGIANEVSPERLQRFFVKLDDRYQISKPIRDLCVFARHDLTRDPPFSRLGLVSCRNLLIYLDQTLQRRIIPLFHYALNPNGFLILGPSENIGRSSDLFHLVEGRRQIYRRQPAPARIASEFPAIEAVARPGAAETIPAANPALVESERAQEETERLLLARYAPASILIDDNLNVVYFHGETGRYLEHSRGPASLNLQKICRPGLLVELAPAIREAKNNDQPVRREGVRVGSAPDEGQEISFEVIPSKLPGIESRYFLVLFGPPSADGPDRRTAGLLVRLWTSLFGAGSAPETAKDSEVARLRRELDATRDYLQSTIEEHEAVKEEMKSAHEEALSSNEEFLSTNEELETAKEELQSANEELGVANQELRNRNRDLSLLNNELSQSRSYQEAIVETLRESLLVLDGNLRVQRANHEFYQTFHTEPQNTLGKHLYDLGAGEWNIPSLRRTLEGILTEVSSLRDFEVTIDSSEYGNRTMLLNAQRLGSNENRDAMILLAIEDVTDRQIINLKLLEADRRKNNFLATLAHELRNPLTPIRMGIDLLRHNANDADLKKLEMMERQIQRLVRLVDDLLDIARIERDHVELRKESLDLNSVVSRAIEGCRHHIDDRHHSLSLVLFSEPIRVIADPVRLEQVVSNLLINAANYTNSGGEISVVVDRVDDDATLVVRDNGIGIAPKFLPQLFEMFFQADASLDRAKGGLGIGLSVTRRLVELHGGRIEGYSAGLGLGSTFTVHLPITRDAENQAVAQKNGPPTAAQAKFVAHRVLIVDDNADTTETLAELARSWGHEVAVAQDGPAALKLAGAFRPEIALIDIGLPEMNGYDLARRLRHLPGMEATRLIAITGYGREEDRAAAQDAGFHLHLIKPVHPDRLEKLLGTLS